MNQHIQLRRAQLYITDEIIRVCNENSISYFIDCGSLLGAVRHGGFIPWDDDMDIGMLKEDYEKFLSVAQEELGSEFYLDNYQTNSNNALVFTKVRLKGTKYIEAKGSKKSKHNEVFVDIFPYYYVSDNRIIRKFEGMLMGVLTQALLSKAGFKVWAGDSVLNRMKFFPTDFIGRIVPKTALRKCVDKLYQSHKNTKYVCIQDGCLSSYMHWYIPVELLLEHMDIKFEDRIYLIPKEYDKYLTIVYGDYMTIPPKEAQVTHMIVELDLGNYNFTDI